MLKTKRANTCSRVMMVLVSRVNLWGEMSQAVLKSLNGRAITTVLSFVALKRNFKYNPSKNTYT